jgi:hypothetical protein
VSDISAPEPDRPDAETPVKEDVAAAPAETVEVAGTALPPAARTNRHRVRRTFSMILLVLAAILMPLSATSVWALRTAFNTDKFTATVSDVLSDPAVTNATAQIVTDQVADVVGPAILNQLPQALKPVAQVIGGAVRSRVEERVNQLISSDAGQKLLKTAVRQAHKSAMRVINGKGLLSTKALTIQNGTVTLNLLPLVETVIGALNVDNILPSGITVPTDAASLNALAQKVGVTLPPNFGQLVIYKSDAVSQNKTLNLVQHYVVLSKRGAVLLIIIGLAVAAGAIALAVNRRRATFWLGLGVAAGSVVLFVAIKRASGLVPSLAATTSGRAVASSLVEALRRSLARVLVILALIGILVAVIARYGPAILRLAARAPEIAYVVAGVLGLIVLLILGIGWGSLLLAIIVTGLCILAIRVGMRRAQDEASPPPPELGAATP